VRQLAVDHVEIGPAHAARMHLHQHLTVRGCRAFDLARLEGAGAGLGSTIACIAINY
jgi:hypothetical protein